MDPTGIITHLSTCSGYEGIGLGLSRVVPNLRAIALSEIEAFAVANLVAKMEAGALEVAPVYSNLKSFPWRKFRGLVGILSGGFPCQPFSAAGKQGADSDPRHLFPHILRGIVECQPDLVFLENVEGIFSAVLKGNDWRDPAGTPVLLHVLRELERVGYRPEAGLFSSAEVGATHQRKRTFILAHRLDAGLEGYAEQVRQAAVARGGLPLRAGRPLPPGPGQWWWEPPRVVQDFVRVANRHGRFVDEIREAALADPAGARCDGREDAGADPSDAREDGGRCVQPERGGAPVADRQGLGRGEGRTEPIRQPRGPDAAQRGEPLAEIVSEAGRRAIRRILGLADADGAEPRRELVSASERPRVPGAGHDGLDRMPGVLADAQGERPGEARGLQSGGPQDGAPRGGEAPGAAVGDASGQRTGAGEQPGLPHGRVGAGEAVGDAACELRERRGPGSEQGRGGEPADPGREAVAHAQCAGRALDRVDQRVGRGGQPDEVGPVESSGLQRQAEPEVGGDADGASGGVDFAELCVSGDSRIDELRLIGNGVDPEVAARAFTVLLGRLAGQQLTT